MTARRGSKQPDWLIPAVLATVGLVVLLALIAFLVVRSTSGEDDRLASQMERWTTCLRSEGVPAPLVEPVGEEGFRVTVDDLVLDAPFDYDSFTIAFDLCLDDAPEAVQTIAVAVDGFRSFPFGGGDLGWLAPLLFEFGSSGMFDDEMVLPPVGSSPLDELCEQLSGLEPFAPDVALELFEFCESEPDV